MRPLRTIVLVTLAVAAAGCDTWLGEAEAPPLPGTRISVLQHERTLEPDPGAEDTRILLPPPTNNPEWPQSGGYPNHAMHHVEVATELERLWTADFGTGASDERRLLASPVVSDGRVYTMDAETAVVALEADTGRRIWRADLTPDEEDDDHISGGVANYNGRIFAATGFAQVVALNASDGSEVWRSNVSGPLRAAPTVRSGRVYVVTLDNRLEVLSADTGDPLWSHQGKVVEANLLGAASPAVDEGIVVVPYSSGELYALLADTGEVLWSDSLAPLQRTSVVSTLSHIRGHPVIDRGRVFAMSYGGVMIALDLRSGRRAWDKDIGGPDPFWVAGNYLYALTRDSEVVCIARNSGRILWVETLPRFEDEEDRQDPIVWKGPVLASDRIIVAGSDGRALALSPYTGRILGQVSLPGAAVMSPVIADRIVYFVTDDAELVAYR